MCRFLTRVVRTSAGLLALSVSVALAGPSDREIDTAAERILSSSDYQKSIPDGPRAVPQTRPAPDRELPDPPDIDVDLSSGPDLTGLFRGLFWVIVVVLVAVGLIWGLREFRRPRASDSDLSEDLPRPAGGAGESGPLPLPEALAQEGRFTEAIHALLLEVIGELDRLANAHPHAAWTSREIVRRTRLPDGARRALGELVSSVELSHFGGVAATEADYHRSRESVQAFRDQISGRAA